MNKHTKCEKNEHQ